MLNPFRNQFNLEKNAAMKFLFASMLYLLAVPIFGQKVSTKTIKIDPYLSFENYEHFKRLTLSSPNSSIDYLDGFDFEWGYQYTLKVNETELSEWLSDGTRLELDFIKIMSKIKVADSTEFSLYIDPKRYYYELDSSEQYLNVTLEKLDDSTYSYFAKVKIEVPEHLRRPFEQLIENNTPKNGRFIFINEQKVRLTHL